MSQTLAFPAGFLWGTASSSHQTEGNNTNNQWWRFEQQPGAIRHGDRSGLACDWWRHAEADFDRMQALGINTHRLSIEWSRVEPEPGVFDHAALDRYRELVGGLRDRGIRPMVCLHHFTDPRWFFDGGGWERSDAPARFALYTRTVVDALKDLCDFWLTINEPLVGMGQSWFRGAWPPHKTNPVTAMKVFRHMLYAHAAAYHTIHARQPDAQVSYAKAFRLFHGTRPGNLLDRYAAGLRRHLFEHIWVMATVDGRIRPPVGAGQYYPPLRDSLDFFGANFYSHYLVRFKPNPFKLFGEEHYSEHAELSDSGSHGPYSEYYPQGLYQLAHELQRLGKPIYITENGLPDADDDQRPRWIIGHLQQLHRAIQDGCDVRGYYHWTFVDNFEWSEGWSLRFGLVEMDPATQVRTPRPSAALYGEIARENAITPAMVDAYAPALRESGAPQLPGRGRIESARTADRLTPSGKSVDATE